MLSEKIRFGLIGCGAVAAKHIEAIGRLKNSAILAVADKDRCRAQEAANRVSADMYLDYRFILERPDIDAVIIATPSGLHAKMTLESLDAGKHVLVEKPMAMTVEDADLMIEMSCSKKKALGVVYHNRFNRASQILKTAVESGKLGSLIWGSASVRWYRPQKYYSESGWRGTEAMDGGVLMNQAIHHIDLLLWLMGDVDELSGFRATLGHDIEAEDTAVASLRFRSGALGSIDATTCAYPENLEETLTIIGTQGSVVMGGKKLDSFRFWNVPSVPMTPVLEDRPNWYGHYEVLRDFTESLLHGRAPSIDGTEGRKSLALVRWIYQQTPIVRSPGGGDSPCRPTN